MGGNGKTTLLRKILAAAPRAIVFDPLGVMYPGVVLRSHSELEDWLDVNGDNSRFRIVYRPGIDEADSGRLKSEREFICWVGRNIKHVSLFFDELDMFCGVDDAGPELVVLLNQGRRHYVDVWGTVRRPQVKVPRDWWTEATVICVFQITDSLDAGVISRKTLIDAAEFHKLQPFQFWEWRNGVTKCCKFQNPYKGEA